MDRHSEKIFPAEISSTNFPSDSVIPFASDSGEEEEEEEEELHHQQQQKEKKKKKKKMMMMMKSSSSEAMADEKLHHHLHIHQPARSLSNSRYGERFNSMSLLDIMRESVTLLRANSSLLISIMFLLVCPVSALVLSRALLHGALPSSLSSRLHSVAQAAGLLRSSFNISVYSRLSETFLSFVFCSPAFFTLWLLAKAAVMFTVACTYASKKASFPMFLSVASKLWRRLLYTYFWICMVMLGFGSMALLFLMLLISFLDALEFSSDLVFLAEMALGVSYSVVFAHMVVIGSLANVVSILEEHFGLTALVRSLYLIKGKTQMALLLFLLTTIGTAMVETLYQYRVLGIPESRYPVSTASRLWEGPLLVFMYSFLYLFDAIMSCVFYFTCKSSSSTISDKQAMWEHISIGLDLTDL